MWILSRNSSSILFYLCHSLYFVITQQLRVAYNEVQFLIELEHGVLSLLVHYATAEDRFGRPVFLRQFCGIAAINPEDNVVFLVDAELGTVVAYDVDRRASSVAHGRRHIGNTSTDLFTGLNPLHTTCRFSSFPDLNLRDIQF